MTDVLVLGGGASGMMAALAAARAGRRVMIAEKLPRVGKKLLATGNGRCNLLNQEAEEHHYHGDLRLVRRVLALYPPQKLQQVFADLGLECVSEEAGRMYPRSRQAAAVLDTLRLALPEAGVSLTTEFECVRVEHTAAGFSLTAKDGRVLAGKALVFAAGGMAAPALGGGNAVRLLVPLGERVTPQRPALTAINTDPALVRALKGQRYEGALSIDVAGARVRTEMGEILFTETGVSGIAAMQLSRIAAFALAKKKPVAIVLSFLPESRTDAARMLKARQQLLSRRMLEDFLTGILAKRIAQTLFKQAGIGELARPAGSLTEAEILRLAQLLTGWRMDVTGVKSFEQAQVTAGGLDGQGFDETTLMSRTNPKLFACGEALDVDGDCGGYNLTWAWASGLVAGNAAAVAVSEDA